MKEGIPDWLSNCMETKITVYSTTRNGKRIQEFLRAKEKEGFDRIETQTESMQYGMMAFKIMLTKLEPFDIKEVED